MRELCDQAHTIVLVSHALRSLRELSDEAIWIDKGQLLEYGPPKEVIRSYQRFLKVDEDDEVTQEDV
jgi:ABC-type polysaccharide/polyol phosphate transport system ATPase subunit